MKQVYSLWRNLVPRASIHFQEREVGERDIPLDRLGGARAFAGDFLPSCAPKLSITKRAPSVAPGFHSFNRPTQNPDSVC